MELSNIGRYTPALFFFISFGLVMAAYKDLSPEWQNASGTLLRVSLISGLAGWIHETATFLITEKPTDTDGAKIAQWNYRKRLCIIVGLTYICLFIWLWSIAP